MTIAGWRHAKRILLVRLDNLGDVLVTTPAFRAVRQSLPAAETTLLSSPIGAQAARLNRDIDEIIEYNAPWMDPWGVMQLDPDAENRIVREIEQRRFDGAIIFTSYRQSSLPAAYLCYQAGIPLRAGASVDGAGALLTTRIKHTADYTGHFPHEVHRALSLVAELGMFTDDDRLELQVPESARRSVRKMLTARTAGRFPYLVVLHPGCSMPARTYPAGMFGEAAGLLARELNAAVFVTGTQSERDLAHAVVTAAGRTGSGLVSSVAGDLQFDELCSLIEAAALTISNNTGPAHVSAAVGTPVLELFALTNPPHQWAPWRIPYRQLYRDVPCRICYSRVCAFQHECLRLVSPREVAESAAEMLGVERLTYRHDQQEYAPVSPRSLACSSDDNQDPGEVGEQIARLSVAAAASYPTDDPSRELGQ